MRNRRLCPPPLCRMVMRPKEFRPAIDFLPRTSGLCGVAPERSFRYSMRLMPRIPGVTGLRFFIQDYEMVIVSPFLRYTYAFFPPCWTPTRPVREFRRRFEGMVTTRTMRGFTLYTAEMASAMLRLVALGATSKRYALCPPAIVPFSVMRGLRRTDATE